jgi:hypothetical protein
MGCNTTSRCESNANLWFATLIDPFAFLSIRSKSHFQRALSTRYSSKSSHEESAAAAAKQQSSASVRGTVASAAATAAEAKKKRTYACPHPHCFNEYRQLGGLRYHLAHVRPSVEIFLFRSTGLLFFFSVC